MGASSKNTFSFSRISVKLSHKWRSAATESAIERLTARAVCLVALRAKSVALRSSFTASGVRGREATSPLIHLLKDVRLVGLKDGHRVEGYTRLTGRDVGLSDKGGSGPTRLGRKEGAGLPGRHQRGWKVGGQSVLDHRHGGVTLLHRTHKVGEVSGRRISKAGGKRLLPGSGDLLMQITKKWQLPPFRLGICTAKEPVIEFRSSRLVGLVGPIQHELLSGARKHVHELRVGSWRPRLLAARRERIC